MFAGSTVYDCDIDTNGCQDNPCGYLNCTDIPAHLVNITGAGYECQKCEAGFYKMKGDCYGMCNRGLLFILCVDHLRLGQMDNSSHLNLAEILHS